MEIHQQLEGIKLFCSCKTVIRKEVPDFTVRRELRASAGETGAIDIAAAHEQKKDKYYLYQGYDENTCLVELDEEPPHEVNAEALNAALQLAHLLNAKIVDEIRFMRKTVVDGSNTSGFQRTALVAVDGFIEVGSKKIRVPTVCLEEEACQVIERTEKYDVYNLSRLGIPLLEIATAPDIETPEECKETAAKLGSLLRSLPQLKRGIGTIRQDVNLSVKGGSRVEIKGFQDHRSIPKVIENEIDRQLALLKSGKKFAPEVRKAEPDFTTSFLRPMPGASRMYPETDVRPIIPEKEVAHVESLEDKSKKLLAAGISADLAQKAASMQKADAILSFFVQFPNIKPAFIAETVVTTETLIRRKEKLEVSFEDSVFESVLNELNAGRIAKDSVYDILTAFAKKGTVDFVPYMLIGDKELEKEIKRIIAENSGVPAKNLVGKAMGALRGRADGKKIIEMLEKIAGA